MHPVILSVVERSKRSFDGLPRCPTECRLSRSDAPWKCTVELRFITDKNGQTLGQARNEAFGDPIFDKSEVEDRIRRAQRAILNPSKPSRNFLDDNEEDLAEVSFSTNYISLQISGPGVADLSFVDLPGKAPHSPKLMELIIIPSRLDRQRQQPRRKRARYCDG